MGRRRLPRTLGFLIAAALVDSCQAATVISLSLWLKGDPWQADLQVTGLVLGLPTAAYVAVTILLGHAADRIGRRAACVIGTAVVAAASVALPLAPSLLAIGLLFGCQRVGAAMFWPALEGWLGHGAASRVLPRRIAAFNIGWGIGWTAGTFLGGLAVTTLGPAVTLRIVAGVAAGASLLCSRLPATLPGGADDGAEPPVPHDSAGRLQAWAGMFAAYVGLGALRALFPQWGPAQLGLSEVAAAAWVAMVSLVQTASFAYLGLVRPEASSGAWLRGSQVIAVVALALVATRQIALAAVALAAFGFCTGVAYAASFYRSVYGREDASRQGGIHEAVVNAGSMAGPVLFGFAATQIGPSAGWYAAAVVIAGAACIGPWRRAR